MGKKLPPKPKKPSQPRPMGINKIRKPHSRFSL